ncbi:MAG: PQQ-binding-like beta-propeller repeat protein [Propionibacteriaceae bacterium]|nr:PQQ-binding-like beta-propeller repeat protein [Propionibacteriaceae bacterium]
METKQALRGGVSAVWRWVRPCLVGVCAGLGAAGLWLLSAAAFPEVSGPSRLTASLWALFGSGVAVLVVALVFLRSRAQRAVCVLALGLMSAATVQAWRVVAAALSWAGPDPAVAMGFSCLSGAGVVLLFVMIPVAEEERLRGRVVVLPAVAGVVLAVAGAGFGVPKVAADLSPVLSITAEAPAQVPGMPGRLPGDTVKGELVATFTSPELMDGTQVVPGARGPILSDEDTVVGVDGETGEQLWQYQLQRRKAYFPLAGYLLAEGWDDRLVLSPDGTTVVFATCGGKQGVLTVLDGLTGQVRFVLPFSCDKERVSVTDHVVVVDRIAYDIHTGEQKWEAKRSQKFLPGTNSSSRLVVLPAISAADDPVPGCGDCIVRPMDVVSDQDPTKVVAQLDRGVRNPPEQQVKLYRGWTVVHDPSDGTNRWLNIETLDALQAPAGDPEIEGSFTGFPTVHSSFGSGQVLDSWSGQVWESPEASKGVGNDPLAENAWVPGLFGTEELTLTRSDGEPLAPPIPLPAPEGESYSSGSWSITDTVRTRDGGATLLKWADDSKEERPILLAIHR